MYFLTNKQENILINEISVPRFYNVKGDEWYPINFISEKVLLKGNVTRGQIDNYDIKIREFYIYYGYDTGGEHLTKCTNTKGVETILNNCKTGGYSLEQRKNYNSLIDNLKLKTNKLLEIENGIISNYDFESSKNKYSEFEQDCIEDILKINNNINWKMCTRCGKAYPLHNNFFAEDGCKKSKSMFMSFCRSCSESKIKPKTNKIVRNNTNKKKEKVVNEDKVLIAKVISDDKNVVVDKGVDTYLDIDTSSSYLNKAYRISEEYYTYCKNHDVMNIYRYCKDNSIVLPKAIRNKEDILIIIKYEYDNGFITRENIGVEFIENLIKIKSISPYTNMKEIYDYLFEEGYLFHPWRYPNLKLPKLSYEEGKIIFNNYLEENNIVIKDIFNFEYGKIAKQAKLSQFLNDVLTFVYEYNDKKHAGYKFHIGSPNYYKNKEHRIFDMKYFIEDMKIDIEKIPLYLTKMTLQKNCSSLYNVLYFGKYYSNLFEWIDECYPNKFIINDFVINPYRNEFDSSEECVIHDILKQYFKTSLIYNQRNTEKTIKINGMIPDWIGFTDEGCFLIEYFGLWILGLEKAGKRNDVYIEKAKIKITKYNELDNYKFIDLYPNDLENNFKGIHKKLKIIFD